MNQAVHRKRMKLSTKMIFLIFPAIIVAAGWLLWQELQQSSIRQAGVPLPAYGVVTVELTTEPFPATVAEPVQMTIRLGAPGGRMAIVDQVTYSYGPVDGTESFQGETREVATETFQGSLQFTTAGDWWIKVDLDHQGALGNARFTIPVRAE